MSSTGPLSRSITFGAAAAVMLQPLAQLLTRLVAGWAIHVAGRGKLENLDNVTKFFADIGIPAPGANAVFIAALECAGGICLLLGLGTRFFAALLSATMIVALLTADGEAFAKAFPGGDLLAVAPVPFLLFFGWLTAFGAGPISLDRLLFRKFAPRSTSAPDA